MRIKTTAELLREVLPTLQINASKIPSSSSMAVTGHGILAKSLRLLKGANVLTQEVDRLLSYSAIVENIEERISVNEETYNSFTTRLNRLRESVKLLEPALESISAPEDEFTLSVKLPEQIDLADLSRIIAELDSALNKVLLNPHVAGTPRFVGFDRGSDWIIVALGSKVATHVIKTIVDQYLLWKGQLAQISQREEAVRSIKLANDARENFDKLLFSALETEKSNYLKDLDNQLAEAAQLPKKANEEKMRILKGREQFWELMRQGIEMHLRIAEGNNQIQNLEGSQIAGRERKSLPPAPAVEES